ncbi:MAG: FG-GAP-like repeat-containing protein [Bryobacteraceae bacterium]
MRSGLGLALLALVLADSQPSAYERGVAAFGREDWNTAETALLQAVKEQPRFARAWKLLGMVYAAREQYPSAIPPLARACALDPAEDKACYYLARAYYSVERFEESRRSFETALRSGTDERTVCHGLALTYEALGKPDEAEKCYRIAIQKRNPEALRDYGLFLYRRGRGPESLRILKDSGDTREYERVRRALSAAPPPGAGATVQPIRFEARELGMVVRNGASGEKHQVETMPAGVAVFDYDNDGWPDIFVANGASLPALSKGDAGYSNRLFHNNRDGTFTDVTAMAGLAGHGYSMGVAAADFDNDGWVDLFVTGVRSNTLYRNRGDGTFEDVTARAGLRDNVGWSIAAGWFDYDNDGRLDLFVVHYVTWDPVAEPFCGDARAGLRFYCHPHHYQALPNSLYHNEGNGIFRDVSRESGIAAHPGKGMGVAFGDYDGDGRLDVFVANDTEPNFLFHNEGNGRFRECALEAGVAFNEQGRAVSSMGVEFRDFHNDGREDLFVTALTNERFLFFRNIGQGSFVDVSAPSRIAEASLPLSGWSLGGVDLNNDGFKDVFTANGNVVDNAELVSDRKSRQENSAFLNRGDGTFSAQFFEGAAFHRGAAFGDFDRDGRMDIVVTRLNEPPLILHNITKPVGHWIELRLVGTRSNRDGLGARVHVVTASREQWNRATTSTGYAASSDRIVHFGLGADACIRRLEVEWPSGIRQVLDDVPADQILTVTETGRKPQ